MGIWDNNFNYNGQAILFDLLLFLVAIWKYRALYLGQVKTTGNYLFVYLLLALFATYAYAEADFYHYQYHYDMMKHYNLESLAEPIYFWITKKLPDNYFLWRFSIWGTAALFMLLSLKKLGIYASYAGFLMPIFFWRQFSITRGGLGFCLIVFSLVYIFNDQEKYFKRFIAIFAALISFFFHESITAFLLMLLLAFVIPLNSKMLKLSIILFPFLYGVTMSITDDLMAFNILAVGTEDLAEKYIDSQQTEENFLGIAFDLLNFSGQLLMLYLAMTFVIKHKRCINRSVIFIAKYGYLLLYVSFMFYGQDVSSFISSRFLHASTFPLFIVYSYYMQHHEIGKKDRIAMVLLGLYSIYELVYHMYKWW